LCWQIRFWFLKPSAEKIIIRTLTNLLATVWLVGDLELGHAFLDARLQLLGSEAHGVDIICPQGQLVVWYVHVLRDGAQAVVNVHHGEACVCSQVALVVAARQRVMEHLVGII